MKRAVSIALAVIWVFLGGALPLFGAAAENEGIYTYAVTDGQATVTRVSVSVSGEAVIPATLGGYPVAHIGENAFFYCGKLTSVILPNGIETIGDSAFEGCAALTCITLPNSVQYIGNEAFCGCSSLTAVTMGTGVTYIGERAFKNCSALAAVTVPNGVTTIEKSTFSGCLSLAAVTLPSGVTAIRGGAFFDCTSLGTLVLPRGVTSIGSNAFYNTGYYNDNSNWTDGVLYIGDHLIEAKRTLSGCYTVKNGTKTIADTAFELSEVTAVVIPQEAVSIGDKAFAYCWNLTSVQIGNGVTDIGELAFYDCPRLSTLFLPVSVIAVGEKAFAETAPCEIWYSGSAEDRTGIRFASDEVFAVTWHMGACKEEHTYDDVCDIQCGMCGWMRNAPHEYTRICDAVCRLCGAVRKSTHIYTGECDAVCDVCGEAREAERNHTYDTFCDAQCNVCAMSRAVIHVDSDSDRICDMCGTACLSGDVNGDGKIDSTDARLVLQYAVSKIEASAIRLAAADVDGSGVADSTDARLILQYTVRKITDFPA